ncbi:hypothetical protein PV327_007257 [Microctonus hyperodae]|uniref:Connectin n=1 Tax=Microctonus hyperodae TaxID=165561 RepID=A0AA39F600_MICHY|nr:hypothetical protein PV327_007257 [Microctonus hyperodae]
MMKLVKLIVALQLIIYYGCLSLPFGETSVQMSDTTLITSTRHKKGMKKIIQTNICDLQQREAPIYCYCDHNGLHEAIDVNCIILNTVNADDTMWSHFITSQMSIERLKLKIRDGVHINYVPSKTLRSLSNLRNINIEYANFDEISEKGFSNISNAYEINIGKCAITHLRKNAFINMSKLTFINLDDNRIIEINREVFVNLPVLKKLFINRNNITLLHDRAFKHLTSLQELELSDNKIAVITTDNFTGLKSLTRLILRSNRISLIGDRTFIEMTELNELEIDQNMIEYISVNAFAGMGKLRKLNLADNKLVKLEADVFAGAPAINFLDLRNNSLSTMTFDNVKPIVTNLYANFSYLYLDDNKFICDCKLAWIKGLRNETVNQQLKDSLDMLTCFLEGHNKTINNAGVGIDSGDGNVVGNNGASVDVNKPGEKQQEHTTANNMGTDYSEVENGKSEEEEGEYDEHYEDYSDQTVKYETGKPQMVNERMGYIKHFFELKLEELPCPEQSRDDPMVSEQPSSRRENAAVASMAFAQVKHAATIGQCLILVALSLFV